MGKKHVIVLLILITGIYACNKSNIDAVFFGFEKPSYFPDPVYHFDTNPVTKDGFELGRKLFYDPILSEDNTISCGSCHIQTSAFTQHGHSTSHGIFNQFGTRNSLPIMNLAWSKTYMWDGGIFNLDLQPIAPITNFKEMGDTLAHVLAKLKNSPQYPALFNKAFGSAEITSANLFKALSQFMVMCVSNNAKYDSVRRGQSAFTMDEQAGYKLYQQRCSSCHAEPLFTDNSFRNNGLAPGSVDDKGRYLVTLQDTDMYKFKVPSLRNLSYSAPYMHTGTLYSLTSVIDHYAFNVNQTPNLDPSLKKGISFTYEESQQLIAFLNTLNDYSFVTDKRLAEQ